MFRPFIIAALLSFGWAPLAAQEAAPGTYDDAPSPTRLWANVDYLLFWTRDDHFPLPLATTGPPGALRAGALGQPSTSVLLGPDLDYQLQSGARVSLGGWLDDSESLGLEASGFVLETHTTHLRVKSNAAGAPVIARPFFNLLTNQQDAQIVASPGDVLGGRYKGGVNLFGDSRTWGGEANLRWNLSNGPWLRWDVIGGFRYLGQKDQLQLDTASTVLAPGTLAFGGVAAAAPNIVSQRDYLETINHFFGGQLGVQTQTQWRRWTLDTGVKAGLGSTQQRLETVARTQLWDPTGAVQTIPAGLFVPGNLESERGQLGFISELDVRLACRITERWRVSTGYSFLYWSNIIRPGTEVPEAIDPRRVPSNLAYTPDTTGSLPLRSTGFWAQGMSLGLEFRY